MRTDIRALAFVVGTGRSGSTALSRVLRAHPDVLSLSELCASVWNPALYGEEPLTGEEFWHGLSEPNRFFDTMVRSGVPLPEFLYNRHPEWRYSAGTTGIPALSLMTLPHLSDDPDGLLDALEPRLRGRPAAPVAAHWHALFDALAAELGGREVAVERSGYSLRRVPTLRRLFPGARFVHLHRDGPDCALSMSRHTGYRMIALVRHIQRLTGSQLEDLTPEQVAALPPDLAPLLGERFEAGLLMDRDDLPVTRFGALWSELVAEGVRLLAEVPAAERMSLSYDRLLDAPRPELTRLAGFLGVRPLPEWLDAAAATLDGGRRGAAARDLPAAELAELRELCAPGARALAAAEAPEQPARV